MILNHLDLQVSDVQKAVAAFETFFGLTLKTSRNSPAIAILEDGHGFILVLQRKNKPDGYPDGFHLGFLVADIPTVERTHALLTEHGAEVSPIDTNSRGTMLYCRLGDGIVVEVSCRRVS